MRDGDGPKLKNSQRGLFHMSSSTLPNDVTVQAAPTAQLAIDLFDGWTSKLPDELYVKDRRTYLMMLARTGRSAFSAASRGNRLWSSDRSKAATPTCCTTQAPTSRQ